MWTPLALNRILKVCVYIKMKLICKVWLKASLLHANYHIKEGHITELLMHYRSTHYSRGKQ